MARTKEQALNDPRQLHIRRPVLGQIREEPPQPLVFLTKPRVDNDEAQVIVCIKQVMEAFSKEHQAGRIHVLRGAEEIGLALRP